MCRKYNLGPRPRAASYSHQLTPFASHRVYLYVQNHFRKKKNGYHPVFPGARPGEKQLSPPGRKNEKKDEGGQMVEGKRKQKDELGRRQMSRERESIL